MALIHCDSCPYEKKSRHRQTQRDNCVRTRGEDGVCTLWREAFEETSPADSLILDFLPAELGEHKLLLFKPPACGVCDRCPSRGRLHPPTHSLPHFLLLGNAITTMHYLFPCLSLAPTPSHPAEGSGREETPPRNVWN